MNAPRSLHQPWSAHAGLTGLDVPRAGTIAVLATDRRHGEGIVRLLRSNGVAAVSVDADRLAAGIAEGTSTAALVTGGALRSETYGRLLLALGNQPAWSDYPFVIVAARHERAEIGLADSLPNAVVIARPLRREALLSATRCAVRARQRQWSIAARGEPDRSIDRMLRQRAVALYASRLSAMGDMASTLAHEVNQPLSTITNYVAGCRRLLANAAASGAPANLHPLFGALAIAEAETMRAGEIVRRMRETVAVADVPRRPTLLTDIVDEACRIALVDGARVAIDTRLAAVPVVVAVDGVAIQHVIVSLIENHCDGATTCGNAGVDGDPVRRVVIAARPGEAGFVELRVSDPQPGGTAISGADPFSAVGVHQEDDVRIRLAICRTIIEAHGGAIRTDGVGADACVAFTLPLAEPLTEE